MKAKFYSRFLIILSFIFLLTLACNLPSFNRNFSTMTPAPASQAIPEISQNEAVQNNAETIVERSGIGESRQYPFPVGSLVNLDAWQIEVRDFLRGGAAFDYLKSNGQQIELPAEGYEYALAYVFVRCVALDDSPHSLGIGDISITASSNRIYGDQLDGQPQPEFLYEDMYTAEAVEGWVDAIIPTNENNLMLVLDLNSWDPATRLIRYFSLEEGASITIPASERDKSMNNVGIEVVNPAFVNQEIILKNWELVTEEFIGGEQALNTLLQSNPKFPPPESGWQYLLFKVKVGYFNAEDIPVNLQFSQFYAVDQTGNLVSGANRFINKPKSADRVWLNERLLPGAKVEGWVIVAAPLDAQPLIIAFDPEDVSWDLTGESKRYIQLGE